MKTISNTRNQTRDEIERDFVKRTIEDLENQILDLETKLYLSGRAFDQEREKYFSVCAKYDSLLNIVKNTLPKIVNLRDRMELCESIDDIRGGE